MDVIVSSACGIASLTIYETKVTVSTTFSQPLSTSKVIDCPTCASAIGTYNYYIKIIPSTGTSYWMDIDFTAGTKFYLTILLC